MEKQKFMYTIFSETGKRIANQDICRVVEMPEENRCLLVVCDGMGGHAMGDAAAETVCNAVCNFWEDNPGRSDCEEKVLTAFAHASEALYYRSRMVRPIEMGTTLVMASVENNTVTIAHCGDSRCYLLRNGEVVHQTTDHSRPGTEIVTRCFFSMDPEVAIPDITRIEVEKGDRIFLCTDGVYKAMAPQILVARLQDDKTQEDVVDVIKFMCEKLSTDNYSGILYEVM
jgi:protein phosphatase